MRVDPATLQRLIEEWQASVANDEPKLPPAPPPKPPLNGGGGDGNSGGMEARVAKLEADMAHALTRLDDLKAVPVDVATIKERLSHLPTKEEAKSLVETSIDKAGTRIQRNIGIGGTLLTILIALASNWSKIFS